MYRHLIIDDKWAEFVWQATIISYFFYQRYRCVKLESYSSATGAHENHKRKLKNTLKQKYTYLEQIFI